MKKLTALFFIICLISISACAETTSSTNTFWTRNYDGTSNATPLYVQIAGLVSDNGTSYPYSSLVTLTGTQTLINKTISSLVLTGRVITNTTTGYLEYSGGTTASGSGAILHLAGVDNGGETGRADIYTPNAAGTGDVLRFSITGKTTNSYANWSSISHDGFALKNNSWLSTIDSGGTSRACLKLSGSNVLYFVNDANGNIIIQTDNASGAGNGTTRLTLTGGVNRASASWANIDNAFGSSYLSLSEMTAPGSGSADTVRIYASVGGDNLTDLNAVYQDGTVDIFSQETTPLTAAQFTNPSDTEVKMIMRKPHPGLIQYGYLFPDGYFQVSREIQYHDAEKIAANKGCITGILPAGWEVTTAESRAAKAAEEDNK